MMVKKLAKVSRFTMNKKFAEIRKFDCIRQNSILVWGRPYIMPAKVWLGWSIKWPVMLTFSAGCMLTKWVGQTESKNILK